MGQAEVATTGERLANQLPLLLKSDDKLHVVLPALRGIEIIVKTFGAAHSARRHIVQQDFSSIFASLKSNCSRSIESLVHSIEGAWPEDCK